MSRNIRTARLSVFRFLAIATLLLSSAVFTKAQGYGDRTRTGGTNGVHTIQGRINLPSNRPAASLKVRLESTNSATLTTLSNSEGVFYFSGLESGLYTIIIEPGDAYDSIRETVTIEREIINSISRTYNLMFDLREKGTLKNKPGVTSASLAKVPKPAREQFIKALEARDKGDVKSAIEKFNEAVRLYQPFTEAYAELGSLYLKTGEMDKAEDALKKALQLDEKNTNVKLNYGITLLKKNKMTEAEKFLREVAEADKTSATPYMYLGIALVGLSRFEEAEKEFLSAVSLKDDEKIARSHWYLGGIYWRKQNYKQAADELEKYLKLSPKAADADKARSLIQQLKEKTK